MSVRSPVISSVIEIIVARTAVAIDADEDVQLGCNGLGLDSIAIAEVLLDCERRFGVRMTDLLGGDAITIGRLTEHIEQNLES
jgi:acyl carrier protein